MVKRSFAERAKRGKKDSLLLSFGEHMTSAGERNLSNLLSKHRGLYVIEHAEGLNAKKAKEFVRQFDDLTKIKGWKRYIQEVEPDNKAHLEVLANFYEKKFGKATIVEAYPEHELLKLKKLNDEDLAHLRLAIESLARKDIPFSLKHYNDFLEIRAKEERIRNSRIVKNLSRMKGNVFMRYGTGHSTIFSDLKRLRPEAQRVFEERPIFTHYTALLRAKVLGMAQNPSNEVLIKAWLGTMIGKERKRIGENLGVSLDNSKLNLFFNALIDTLPEKNLEGILSGIAANPIRYMHRVWSELSRQNNLQNLLDLKPKDQLKIMRSFSARVYGEHNPLYQVAYPARPRH